MRGCSSMLAARRLALFIGTAAVFVALAGSGAATPADRVAELRAQATSLEARQRAATLELYAYEAQLAAAQARLGALSTKRARAEEQLVSLRIQLDAAWQSAFVAEERLGMRLRQLYQAGELDPVAVILGSESLDEAITGLEGLRSLAAGDRDLVDQVRRARGQLAAAKKRISSHVVALRAAEDAAAATASSLAAARDARRSFLRSLARERGLTSRRIAAARATAAQAASRGPSPTTAPAAQAAAAVSAPAQAAPAASNGSRTLTVEATGYALRGRTATGIPTAWGVVAVDPSVIPLGTRLTIPGYGEGIAADTGGAVRGAKIDLWFPSVSEALTWGRRTVTITIHG